MSDDKLLFSAPSDPTRWPADEIRVETVEVPTAETIVRELNRLRRENAVLQSKLEELSKAAELISSHDSELRRKIASYHRAIGLIRAKAAMWPSCAASAADWFREITDVCDLVSKRES